MTTIKIGVEVNDGGSTARVNSSAEKLKGTLEGAAKAANSIRVPVATAAAQKGVLASNAGISGGSEPPIRRNASAPSGQGESKTARSVGVAAGTGSAASDFAAQSQGLGGLVHVYATFAANLYAVSAAFGALSKSMDTANLVRGLDQIGAASGRNLGSVAKQMVAAADGAISLRDAMTSTAMASSGGMTNQAIIRMTEVAKKASLALGRDMPDSMERLTKGIVKIQPELLDELGIMTRVIPAQQEYARQIGKTAATLTDFEKRQAFANAVLAEGEKKFGAINLDANPYTKVLASMQNVMQSGLELVNKVLGPVLKMLSESPTGLAVAMAGIASILLKQAVPALGMFRENLQKMADMNQATAIRKATDAVTAKENENKRIESMVEQSAEVQVAAVDASVKKVENLKQGSLKKTSAIYKILDKDVQSITDKELARIEATAKAMDTKGMHESAQGYRDIVLAVKESKAAEEELVRVKETNTERLKKEAEGHGTLGQTIKLAARAELDAKKSIISSNAAYTGSTLGVTAAITQMNRELSANNIQGFAKVSTQVRGTVAAIGGAVGTAVNAFGMWGQVISLVGVGFGVLSSYLSTNEKQIAAFGTAIDTSSSSVDNMTRTIEYLGKLSPLEQMSIASINAIATAFLNLSDSLNTLQGSSKKAMESLTTNDFDKFTNWVSKAWGGDIASKTSKQFSSLITSSLDGLDTGSVKTKYIDSIKSILSIKDLSSATLIKAVKDIASLDPSQASLKFKQLQDAVAATSLEVNNSASRLSSYKLAFDNVTRSSQDFINSMINTDPMFKYGASLLQLSDSLMKLSGSPEEAIVAFTDLLQDTEKLGQFSEETSTKLLGMKDAFLASTTAAKANSKALEEAKDKATALNTPEVQKYRAKYSEEDITKAVGWDKLATKAMDAITAELAVKELKVNISKVNINYEELTSKASNLVARGMQESFIKGADLIDKSLGMAGAKAAIEISKAAGIGLTGSRATEQGLTLVKQEIGLRIQEISLRQQEILAMDKLNNTILLSEATKARDLDKATGGGKQKELQQTVDVLTGIGRALSGGSSTIKAAYTAGRSTSVPRTQEQEDAQVVTQRVAQGVSGTYAKTAALDSAKTAENAKLTAAYISAQYKSYSDSSEPIQQNLKKLISTNNEEATRLGILDSILGSTDESILKRKQEAEFLSQVYQQALDNIPLQDKINAATALSLDSRIKGEDKVLQGKEAANTQTNLNNSIEQQGAKNTNKLLTDSVGILKQKQDSNKRAYELALSETSVASTRLIQEQQVEEAKYEAMLALGGLTEVEKANLLYNKEIQASNLSTQIAINAKKAEGIELEKSRKLNKPEGEGGAAYDTETARQQSLIQNTINSLGIEQSARERILGINKESSIFIGSQADNMTKMVDITSSLATVFGTLGESIGKAGEAILKMSNDQKTGTLASIALEEEKANIISKLPEGSDPKDRLLATKDVNEKITKLDKKSALDQVSNIGSVAGASKKMFGEKTFAYKALNAVEKAMHVAKLTMMVAEVAANFATVGPTLAAEGTKSAAKGVGAILSAFSAPFPVNFVAGAAMIAIVAGLLGTGAGSSSIPVDQGTLAGTGQNADGTTREGGVLGDPKATAKSVNDSIEGLSKVFFNNLGSGSSALIQHLKGIQTNTYDTAKALGETTGGIGSSNPFDISTVTGGGGGIWDKLVSGILGGSTSTNVTGAGVKGTGTATGLASGASSIYGYTNVHSETSAPAWGIFGGGSSKDEQVLSSLPESMKKALMALFDNFNATILDTAGYLGKTKEELQAVLDTSTIKLQVSNAGLTGTEFATKLTAEISIQLNKIALETYPFLKNYQKVGEESFTVAARLIKDGETVTYGLKMIGKAVEGVATISQGPLWGLFGGTIGISAVEDNIAKQQKIIENFGGTADDFANAITGYYDALFNDREKAAFSYSAVQEQLGTLGYTSINTKTQLRALIDTMDPTTKTFADLVKLVPSFVAADDAITKLKNSTDTLSVTLLQAQGYTDKALQLTRDKALKDLSPEDASIQRQIDAQLDLNKTRGLENTLLTAQGKATEVLARNRALELKGMSATDAALQIRINLLADNSARLSQEAAIYTAIGDTESALAITRAATLATMVDALKPGQIYLNALQDETALKAKLKTAYDKENTALKSTLDSLSKMIKSLKDARDAMLTGGQSPLTPAERYAEAKRQAYSVAAIAVSIATTDAEITARNDAISKLPSVTGTFLDASKELYASSEQYTQDFNSVLKILDNTSTLLGEQETDAQKQLDSLNSIGSSIDKLLEPTISAASYLQQLNAMLPSVLAAREAAAAAGSTASGSTASGSTSYFDKYADVKASLTPYITSNGISEAQLSAIHYAYWGYKEHRENPDIPIDSSIAALTFKIPKEAVLAQAKLAGVEAFAKGGVASGLSMVGEQGPELIDFKTPTRVYSNTASNQLLSNKELIEEIRRLRTEVSELRTEQKEQTGHLIQANYDSNAQNAKAIADATTQAAVDTTWSQRTQLKLA